MENLLKVLEYLQNNDKNGNYMEMLEEIEDGTLTVKDAKQIVRIVLMNWYNNNLTDKDIVERARIKSMLGSLI